MIVVKEGHEGSVGKFSKEPSKIWRASNNDRTLASDSESVEVREWSVGFLQGK
jgi:hypothetical protein